MRVPGLSTSFSMFPKAEAINRKNSPIIVIDLARFEFMPVLKLPTPVLTPNISPSKQLKLWSIQEIQSGINEARILIINSGFVYDLTEFAASHPGGQLVLQHMNGTFLAKSLIKERTRAMRFWPFIPRL